ncbi:Trypsin-like peptidase domain-containing protein [Pseudobutyrivibrio sp. YE44]|uniref:FHA domain-containing protein n=1 Tax=Pseudobutyrivibrio sp. YE44 TaxID=1520802 RepID=UPI00088A8E01|nr:FHA domain-containing protein [Pseudobutyrivibrio sp. YE44]SDB40049.1 Trypsin-like peptidase domain-containing protein [Pseudobutyrivibrio sp. YE44]
MFKRVYAVFLAMTLTLGIGFNFNTFVSVAAEDKQPEEAVTEVEAEQEAVDEADIEEVPDSSGDTDVIDAAKNGVVQINCVYKDSEGKSHIFKGAAGILIGNSEKEEYVITTLQRMNPEAEEKNAFLAAVGVGADERERAQLEYEVVIENDITAAASMVSSSADLDMAVFKLSQVLYNRTPMKFIYSENEDKNAYNVVDTAYALGFPSPIDYQSEVSYYSNDRVNKATGQLSNVITEGDIQFLEHKAEIGENNVGGPLITADGEVIGMNALRTDGNYYYAVSSNTIVKVLNGMGIAFDGVTFEEKEAAAKAEEEEKNKAKEEKKDKVIEVHTETPKWVIPVIIAFAVLLVAAITAVIILLVKTLKAKEANGGNDGLGTQTQTNVSYQFQPTIPAGMSGELGSDTTVLGAASAPVNPMMGMNMAAPSGQLNGGSLLRQKNNETIPIMKNTFCLGKDDLHCDYCIRDNNTISRQHAIITVNANGASIADNHSKNGTFLNGVMLVAGQPQELRDGDEIRLSNEVFVYTK